MTDKNLPALPAEDAATDVLRAMRQHTTARIALGRTGGSLPMAEVLRFGLSHAQARDAVHLPLDVLTLADQLKALGLRVLTTHSRAPDRHVYLLRPDLGRQLDEASLHALTQEEPAPEIAVVVADGLSSIAVQRHAVPVIERLKTALPADWQRTPVVLVEQGRVAVGDDIGAALQAKLVILLIGERPGLSSPDSLGLYLTYAPRRGLLDNARNCISNVRPEGLPYDDAVVKLRYLVAQSLQRQLTGVALKDNSDQMALE